MINSDSILTSKVRAGDAHAFKDLFYLHSAKLCKWSWSITSDKQAAEDIVQEFFITYWERKDTLFFNPSFLSYAYRSIYNSSLNYIRDNDKYLLELNDSLGYSEEQTSFDAEVKSNETKVLELINTLPPRCKQILIMAKLEERTYAEIAEELSISTNTVKAQISKAYTILRDHLALLIIFGYF